MTCARSGGSSSSAVRVDADGGARCRLESGRANLAGVGDRPAARVRPVGRLTGGACRGSV